jgi:hypothetical protein
MAISAVALAGIVGFPLLWPTSYFYFSLTSPPRWSAWRGGKPATQGQQAHVAGRRRKVDA